MIQYVKSELRQLERATPRSMERPDCQQVGEHWAGYINTKTALLQQISIDYSGEDVLEKAARSSDHCLKSHRRQTNDAILGGQKPKHPSIYGMIDVLYVHQPTWQACVLIHIDVDVDGYLPVAPAIAHMK